MELATGKAVGSSPAVANGVVYIGSYAVYAFDLIGSPEAAAPTPRTPWPDLNLKLSSPVATSSGSNE